MTLTLTQCLSGVFTTVKGKTFMSYNGGVSFRPVRNSDAFRSCISCGQPSTVQMLSTEDARCGRWKETGLMAFEHL